jgi:enoyl-[acyl-carrier-protein] reductase (NADH)
MYGTVESARQGDATAAELVYREAADGTSLGYLPTADEVAGSVMFFASPLSAPVTGQILNVNAGAWTS